LLLFCFKLTNILSDIPCFVPENSTFTFYIVQIISIRLAGILQTLEIFPLPFNQTILSTHHAMAYTVATRNKYIM
jgi:hypothetical protein